MNLQALRARVQTAEHEVETQRARTVAECRKAVGVWRAGWTPGRIVIAGLAVGFASGRAQPLRLAGSSGVLALVRALAKLLEAGGSGKPATTSEPAPAADAPPADVPPTVWPNAPRRTTSPFVTTPTP